MNVMIESMRSLLDLDRERPGQFYHVCMVPPHMKQSSHMR